MESRFSDPKSGSPTHVVGRAAAALAVGLSVEYVESWPDRIGAITAADVNAAARAVLKDSHSVTSLLLQKKTG